MADAKDDILREIAGAWDKAQSQLQDLKRAVQRTEQMASLRTQVGASTRELDRALRDLGEAVWKAAKAGALRLPGDLTALTGAVEKAEQRRAALSDEIGDILQEGEEAAGRKREKPAPQKSGLASKPKSR